MDKKITIVKYNGRKYQDTIAGDCTNGDIYTWDGMCFDRLTLLDKVIPKWQHLRIKDIVTISKVFDKRNCNSYLFCNG